MEARTYTPDQIASIVKDYEKIKQRQKDQHRKYYDDHAAERRAYSNDYYEANKEFVRIKNKNRYRSKVGLALEPLPNPNTT